MPALLYTLQLFLLRSKAHLRICCAYMQPPFATGLPHYGHLLAGTIKVGPPFTYPPYLLFLHEFSISIDGSRPMPDHDLPFAQDIVTRYATGTGHHCPRRFGWDCHGLPVEYEIDKKLGEKDLIAAGSSLFP